MLKAWVSERGFSKLGCSKSGSPNPDSEDPDFDKTKIHQQQEVKN
jgi:hypothetical protein